ncbi:MAG: vWA domain-containing protein [Pseudomonadota bacterium]
MNRFARVSRIGLCLALTVAPLAAEPVCTSDAMIVFDGSGSMSEMGFNQLDLPRIFEARQAIRTVMPRVERVRRVGLIVYGPGPRDACSNIALRFPPIPNAATRVIGAVDTLEPAGDTPLTEAVAEAARTLRQTGEAGVVVLVTDGKETCGGAPCQLAATLAADAPGLVVHVIGFKVRGDYFSWESQGGGDYTSSVSVARCLAETTGGQYVPAETVEDLIGALQRTLGCQLIGVLGQRPENR